MSARKGLSLFVGNLKWTVAPGELRSYFQKFGPLNHSKIFFTKNGWSKGFGFVTFKNSKSYYAALNQTEHLLCGETLTVAPSQTKDQEQEKTL